MPVAESRGVVAPQTAALLGQEVRKPVREPDRVLVTAARGLLDDLPEHLMSGVLQVVGVPEPAATGGEAQLADGSPLQEHSGFATVSSSAAGARTGVGSGRPASAGCSSRGSSRSRPSMLTRVRARLS